MNLGDDVRARWAASAASAASQAYSAAYGREIPDDATRMRWRLEPRVAMTAAVVLVLLGVATWWAASPPASLPVYVDAVVTSESPRPISSVGNADSLSAPGAGGASGPSGAPGPTPEPGLVVHVSGAVAHPGLVSLADGDRVADAVEQAGGISGDADLAAINLARLARDGEQIHVPLVGEATAPGAEDAPVNLNTATAEQLETLPGIGPVLAQRVVADRDSNGPFASLTDLARVTGVGEALVTGLAELAIA